MKKSIVVILIASVLIFGFCALEAGGAWAGDGTDPVLDEIERMLEKRAGEHVYVGDQIATTKDGKKVILKDDKTWEYAPIDVGKEDKSKTHFRNVRWGMSQEEVKQAEGNEKEWLAVVKDKSIIGYKSKISGIDAFTGFVFVNEKLVRASYLYTPEYINKNNYLIDYEIIKKIMIKKHGKPIENETVWQNDLYKKKPEDYGTAISIGHLILYSKWEKEDTNISLFISGEKFKIRHKLEYASKSLHDLEKRKNEEQEDSDYK